jgi:hypothetical protein
LFNKADHSRAYCTDHKTVSDDNGWRIAVAELVNPVKLEWSYDLNKKGNSFCFCISIPKITFLKISFSKKSFGKIASLVIPMQKYE